MAGSDTMPDLMEEYTLDYHRATLQALAVRTAEDYAAHLLPLLEPGMRVLDVGCGPGTITVGLARRVGPGGRVDAVDVEDSQVKATSDEAARRGIETVHARNGNATELPFEDRVFDVVHCHNVLVHVPSPEVAVREARRVLKPGGMLSVREIDCERSFFHPDPGGGLAKAWEILTATLMHDDKQPLVGRELGRLTGEGGFGLRHHSMSFSVYRGERRRACVLELARHWTTTESTGGIAVQYGCAGPEDLQRIREATEAWAQDPYGICAVAYGEVIGEKKP